MPKRPTQTDIDAYVKTLDNVVQELHKQIKVAYILTMHDTLSDEFQIVASLDEVFLEKTKERMELYDKS